MAQSGSSSQQMVTLNPANSLSFQLERGTQPRAVLKITNTSGQKLAFKVKTTMPTWYYVRPNQQILDENQSEDVVILMVEAECNRLLDQAASGSTQGQEEEKSHRFLVQIKTITDEEFIEIKVMSPSQKMDEISKLWDSKDDSKKNMKLKVEFKYPDVISSPSRQPGVATKMPTSVAESVEQVRSRLQRSPAETDPSSLGGNPDLVVAELQNLRKKYDAVVEYTVHLTAERDSIVAQLESAQRELNKEKSKKKADVGVGKLERKGFYQGFSLFVVLASALICFLLGKYLS
jgi:vesicle-associated membrane protein-associated protein A